MCFIVCFSALHSHFSVSLIFHFFWAKAHLPWSVRNLFNIDHSLLDNLKPGIRVPGICITFLFTTVSLSHEECHFSMIVLFADCNSSPTIRNGVLDLSRVLGGFNRTEFIGNCWLFLYLFQSFLKNSSRLSEGVGIFYSIGNHGVGVGLSVPLIIRMVVFSRVSIFFVCLLWIHTGAQYSATEYTNEKAATLSVSVPAPHPIPVSFVNRLFLVLIICVSFSMCGPEVRDLSKVTPRYFGAGLCCTLSPSNVIFIIEEACLLFRWKIIDSVICGFGLSLHFLKYRLRVSRSSSRVFSQYVISLY